MLCRMQNKFKIRELFTARMEQFPKNGGKMYVFDYGILRTGSRFR